MTAYNPAPATILAAQRGDRAALQSLLSLYEPPIRRIINQKVGSKYPDLVDDLVQEIHLRLVAHVTDFDFGRRVHFTTWIYSLVKNLCIDVLKRRRLPTHSMVLVMDDGDEIRDTFDKKSPQPDARAIKKEFRRQLVRSLRRLPREQARIFFLREVGEMEFPDIAKRIGQPTGTVKSKYYRAQERLQYLLTPYRPAA